MEKIDRLLRELEKITQKMEAAKTYKDWQDLHCEKICISREIEFERGY